MFFGNFRTNGHPVITLPFETSQNVKDIRETINDYKELRNKVKPCFKCLIYQQTSKSPVTLHHAVKKYLPARPEGCKSTTFVHIVGVHI